MPKIAFYSIHELGKRDNQEDSIYPSIADTRFVDGLFILCDGMGGHAYGEVASKLVCEKLSKYISENVRDDAPFGEEEFYRALDSAYDALDANDVVLIHDDLLATGGTMEAAVRLVKQFHVKKIYVNFLVSLDDLKGADFLDKDLEVISLIHF